MIEGRLLVKFKLPRKIIAGENLDSMVDLTNYLKPWPGKARTMRQEAAPPQPVLGSLGDSTSDDQNENHSLQVLGSEESVHLESSRCSSSEEELRPTDDSGKLKRKLEETEDGPGRGDKSRKTADSGVDCPRISDTEIGADHDGETRESEIKINNNPDEISLSNMKSSSRTDEVPADIKNQVTSLVHKTESPTAPETPKRYACSLCGKTFSGYLALGGHKSSHKKSKMIIYNASDYRRRKKQSMLTNTCDQQTGKIAWSGEINTASPESVVGDDRTHTCKICFKKFSSGQALGGHQRRHWTGNMPDQKTLSAPKILDFDLNELPKEEEEEEDGPSSKC